MAHDRMTNDDLDRNMGRADQEDEFGGQQDLGQKVPGRNPQDQQMGQKGAGQKNRQSGLGGAEEEDDLGTGTGQGGRNPGQNK